MHDVLGRHPCRRRRPRTFSPLWPTPSTTWMASRTYRPPRSRRRPDIHRNTGGDRRRPGSRPSSSPDPHNRSGSCWPPPVRITWSVFRAPTSTSTPMILPISLATSAPPGRQAFTEHYRLRWQRGHNRCSQNSAAAAVGAGEAFRNGLFEDPSHGEDLSGPQPEWRRTQYPVHTVQSGLKSVFIILSSPPLPNFPGQRSPTEKARERRCWQPPGQWGTHRRPWATC